MADEKQNLIRFRCKCGVALAARAALVGRKGKCQQCGHVNIIPTASSSDAPSEATAVREICNVCQTAIDDDDLRIICSRCALPFHEECWRENLGCAAYGCENVNVLKSGPDLRIENQTLHSPWQSQIPGKKAMNPAPSIEEDQVPWDFIIMGCIGLSALVSCVTFGCPSVIFGGLALFYFFSSREQANVPVFITGMMIATLSGLAGFLFSFLYWWI